MSVRNPFKYTTGEGKELVIVNGVQELSPGMILVNRYGIIVIIGDGDIVFIKGRSGLYYKKNLKSVITQHSNGYYYLLYSSKNIGLRRDTCLFYYSDEMDGFFFSPRKNRSDYALATLTFFGVIKRLDDANSHKQNTEEESIKRLPTYKELYM